MMVQHSISPARSRLGRNFRFLRDRSGLSQRSVERFSGVPQKTISNIESPGSGVSPLMANVERLAQHYGLSMASLLVMDLESRELDPGDVSELISSLSKLSETQLGLLLSLTREFASTSSEQLLSDQVCLAL